MKERDRIFSKVRTIIHERKDGSTYIGEDDYVLLNINDVSIRYHIKQDNLNIRNVLRTVKRTQYIIKDLFGYNVGDIEIDIYDSNIDMMKGCVSKSKYGSWIAGLFDGKIKIVSEKDNEDPDAIYIILTHEIVHLALNLLSKGNVPYWIDEGVAIFLSQELPDNYVEILRSAIIDNAIPPIDVLSRPFLLENNNKFIIIIYAQCHSLVEFIIDTYGFSKLHDIIIQSANCTIERILANIGLNHYLLEQGWKRWFRKKYA